MERSKKPRSMLLKFLPRAASAAVTYTFSPGRDPHHHKHKGFSGPINFSALPDEARSRPNHHDNNGGRSSSFETQEPTSPKVSCMGQIKYNHKKKKLMKKAASRSTAASNNIAPPALFPSSDEHHPNQKLKKSSASAISKFFSKSPKPAARRSSNGGDAPDADHHHNNDNKNNSNMPNLGSMRKFASGRESLANFDWTAHQIAPIDHGRDCYSDEERGRDSDDNDDDDDDGEEREVIIPFSAPILVGGRGGVAGGGGLGLEPRKEVNLWKRRTLAPPPPLALNSKG